MPRSCIKCGASLQSHVCSYCGTKHIDKASEKAKKDLLRSKAYKERACKICKSITVHKRDLKTVGGFWKYVFDTADYYIIWRCEDCDNKVEIEISPQEHHKISMQIFNESMTATMESFNNKS